MLAVGAALDVGVGVVVHEVAHVAGDGDKVSDDAIVHDSVAAEHEGVVIDGRDGRGSGGSDVGEADFGGGVGANAAEVGVVEGGLGVLVEGGAVAFGGGEIVPRGGVPGQAEAVDVKEAVARGDLVLGGDFVGVVREEFGQVVLVDLFGEGVRLGEVC